MYQITLSFISADKKGSGSRRKREVQEKDTFAEGDSNQMQGAKSLILFPTFSLLLIVSTTTHNPSSP